MVGLMLLADQDDWKCIARPWTSPSPTLKMPFSKYSGNTESSRSDSNKDADAINKECDIRDSPIDLTTVKILTHMRAASAFSTTTSGRHYLGAATPDSEI